MQLPVCCGGKEAAAFPAPENILSTMRRRGPDSEGTFVSDREDNPLVTLYHARLAVIDPGKRTAANAFPNVRKSTLCNCL